MKISVNIYDLIYFHMKSRRWDATKISRRWDMAHRGIPTVTLQKRRDRVRRYLGSPEPAGCP
jgi:hypothetical protein